MAQGQSETLTFLFTDIEQSTRRWEEHPETMRSALADHDTTLRRAIESRNGRLVKHTGDGIIAVFASARAAIDAAVRAQRELKLPVRMGICTGEVETRDNDYFGPALNRAARTMAAAHGGQILVAASTASIVSGVELVDLGRHRLRDLSQEQHLFQVSADGLQQEFPSPRTLSAIPTNLPAQATSFLGRDKDVQEVSLLLRKNRLVTLTGVGGVGKTRLAIQVAGEMSPDFPDGVWLVELSAVGDGSSVGHAIAAVVGLAQQQGKTIEESVVEALGDRRLLLVMDNCEHLVDAAASMIEKIIVRCFNVVVLATSREALLVDGEQNWPVPSLALGDGIQSPAASLFIDRARAVAPDFEPAGQAGAIAEICRRLDGIPLAIELAAARVRSMSPPQIRDRLNERFRLLTGARRALDRHQTLRNAVQWSYDLLASPERTLLARLSTFSGGFSLDACEQVCSTGDIDVVDLPELLDSLVRKSLITTDRSGQAVRFGLLETIRQFGEERLASMGESDALNLRHARFFAADSDTHFDRWLSPDQRSAYEWLDREMDNLRSAFRWAKEGGYVDLAARIASNIGDMGRFRVREEAASWAEEIVASARDAKHRRLMVLLTWAASAAWSQGRFDDAERFGSEAVALAGDEHYDQFVWAFADLAMVTAYRGNIAEAIELVRRGSQQEADKRDLFCRSFLLYFLAVGQQLDEAIELVDGVIEAAEESRIPSTIILANWAKGETYSNYAPDVAQLALERALTVARESGNPFWETMVAPRLIGLQTSRDDPFNALGSLKGMLAIWRGSADLMFASHGLGSLIILFERVGEAEAAALLNGVLTRALQLNVFLDKMPDALQRLRRSIGEQAFEREMQRGAAMTWRDAIEFASRKIDQLVAAADRSFTQP